MIGQKITKPVSDWNDYTQAALWCSTNGATIEDRGDCYEIVALPEAPEPTLEEVKAKKLEELSEMFGKAARKAHCPSSLGFEINADETANRNVTSLIAAMEATGEESVPFCAWDNVFHQVTRKQLRTMQLEIIAYERKLYAKKWALREAIAQLETGKEVEAIKIVFSEEDA